MENAIDIVNSSFTLESRLAELWRLDFHPLREHPYLFNRPLITPKVSLPPPSYLSLLFLFSNPHSSDHLPPKNKVSVSEVE